MSPERIIRVTRGNTRLRPYVINLNLNLELWESLYNVGLYQRKNSCKTIF